MPLGGDSTFVSPDGRYFFSSIRSARHEDLAVEMTREFLWRFWMSPESGNSDIYWIDAGFIEDIRPER